MNWTLPLLLACLAATVMAVALVALRRAVRSARQQQAWTRTLLDTAVDAVVAYDIDGNVLDCNPSAERLFGMSRLEMLTQRMGALLPVGVDTGMALRRLAVATDGGGMTHESQAVRRDGSRVAVRVATGHSEANGLHTFVAFISDISARQRSDSAIRTLGAIVASSDDAIIGKTLDGEITSWNAGSQKMFGHSADEAIGRSALMLVPPERADDEARALAGIARGQQALHFETVGVHRDGHLIDLSVTLSPIHDERGRVVGASMIARDMTERRRMEVELRHAKEHAERAAEARAAFLANMSHEIRTPMNAILGFTDVLLMGSLTEQQRRHLDVVRSAGGSLLRLLDGVLDSAKLDRGAVELELADFDLAALIDELAASHGAAARAKGLVLAVNYAPSVPRLLHGDSLRVRQVLTNLLSNAVKFTAAGRIDVDVSVEARATQRWLRLSVCDTGIGIAPDRQMAIFEPFTQADATMSRRFGGTGLGTTISKQLVELMGGHLTLDSEPGVGSRFHVRLPMQSALAQPVEPPRASAPRTLPPLRVLIADDVQQNLDLLALQLEPAGHLLARARDGGEAVAQAAHRRFDVILMDLQMPDLDGLQATERIRAHEAARGLPPVPVIAITASVQAGDRIAARAAGMAGFVSKPVDPGRLTAEIARVLGLEDREVDETARDAAGAHSSSADTQAFTSSITRASSTG